MDIEALPELVFIAVCVVAVLGWRVGRLRQKAQRRSVMPTQFPAQSASATPASEHAPALPAGQTLKGRVFVIDGDTIVIKRTKIRLAGIDAPELDMPWGQKSKWAMVDICKGKVVTAVLNGETSHDRMVATCYLSDGRDIGAELIKRGLALDLPYFSGGAYRSLEPEGARRRLANGAFGHRSIGARRLDGR